MFLYAWKARGIRPRDLGISNAYANMIANGKRNVSSTLCEKLLSTLTARDLIEVVTALTPRGAAVAQPAERRPGKAEVPGSNPGGGSTLRAFAHNTSSASYPSRRWKTLLASHADATGSLCRCLCG